MGRLNFASYGYLLLFLRPLRIFKFLFFEKVFVFSALGCFEFFFVGGGSSSPD